MLSILFGISLFIGGALNLNYRVYNDDIYMSHCTGSGDFNSEDCNDLNRIILMQILSGVCKSI